MLNFIKGKNIHWGKNKFVRWLYETCFNALIVRKE